VNSDSAPPKTNPTSDTEIHLNVQPGQRLELAVQATASGKIIVKTSRWHRWKRILESEWVFAGVGLLLAGILLFAGITHYPAQVSPEEVYPSLRARELIQYNFSGSDHALLPAFLPGSTPFEIGTGAYLQVLPQFFRPNTLGWIRSLNALLALLAAVSLMLWLRWGLRIKVAWLFLPIMAVIPIWFTFSRTGLDITLAASLCTAALSCYGFYRTGHKGFLIPAILVSMLAFYAAPVCRLTIPAAVLLLVAFDWHYHWQQRRLVVQAFLLTALLAVPLVIFLLRHPAGFLVDLAASGSFLIPDGNLWQNAAHFTLSFLNIFNPLAWFLRDPNLPPVVQTGPFSPLPVFIAPLVFWGGWISLKNFRQPEYRLLWIGVIAGAVGAAPYGGKLPQTLIVVPILGAFTVIGLQALVNSLRQRWKRIPAWLPNPAFLAAFAAFGLLLLHGALNNTSRWKIDYSREGVQFGAPQIFSAVKTYAENHPQRTVLVWPEWSSDPEAIRQFFVPDLGDQVQMGTVDPYLYARRPDLENLAFVLTGNTYLHLIDSGKFVVDTMETIAYPDRTLAFALVELQYTPQLEQILASEAQQRRQLVSETIPVEGQTWVVRHSRLDIGGIENLFDHSPETLVRTFEANPLVVELVLPESQELEAVQVLVGAEPIQFTATVMLVDGSPLTRTGSLPASSDKKTITLDFGSRQNVRSLRLEVLDQSVDEPAHVHAWEIGLNSDD